MWHNLYVHYHREIRYYFLLHYWHFLFMDTLWKVRDCNKSHVTGLVCKVMHSINFCRSDKKFPCCLTEQGLSQLFKSITQGLWARILTAQWSSRFSRRKLFLVSSGRSPAWLVGLKRVYWDWIAIKCCAAACSCLSLKSNCGKCIPPQSKAKS